MPGGIRSSSTLRTTPRVAARNRGSARCSGSTGDCLHADEDWQAMWKKSSGVFMGVEAGWQLDDKDAVDQAALSKAFDELREEAASQGCVSFGKI